MGTTVVDITGYIDERGLMDVDALLRDRGMFSKDDLMNLRIDTTSLAQMLGVSLEATRRYVRMGVITLDHNRRIKLGEALRLDVREVKAAARCVKGFAPKRQKRPNRVR